VFNSYPQSFRLGQLLSERSWRLSLAESCTGGLVANNIVRVSGASEWFDCSFVTYTNESKHRLLGVSEEMLQTYGAVSPQVAKAMAEGCLAHSAAQLGLSVTGVAGPSGGSKEKPVGTVYMGFALASGESIVRHCYFTGGRRWTQLSVSSVLLSWACELLSQDPLRLTQ